MRIINCPHNKKIFNKDYHKIFTKILAKAQYSCSVCFLEICHASLKKHHMIAEEGKKIE